MQHTTFVLLCFATLMICYNICHWLADYTHLSTPSMLAAKKIGKPLLPIFMHALVHAFLMNMATLLFIYAIKDNIPVKTHWHLVAVSADTVFILQLLTHFAIDVLKGKLNIWFPALGNPVNKGHWYIFGLDQLGHQIVIIAQACLILQYLI